MNKVVEIIREEINTRGPMSFARFMELALYCPDCGYYETIEDRIGRQGDYFTSVSVGPVFGQLLAAQFAEWLQRGVSDANSGHTEQRVGSGKELQLVEGGAHDGQLAKDILAWLREMRPELFKRLRYSILEPSAKRRIAQERMLSDFSGQLSWFKNLQELRGANPAVSFFGIIFGNELLDAMPVRVFRWNAKMAVWLEWGVTSKDGQFCWAPLAAITAPFSLQPPAESGVGLAQLYECLPDGYQIEIAEPAIQWWRDAAKCLDRGWLISIDYGFRFEELFSPARIQGTLRGYREHRSVHDVLRAPGEQDITAQVNFSSLQMAGEELGLESQEITSQSKFLNQAGALIWKDSRNAWDAKSIRQFHTLTHPDHFGRAFQVIVQSRGLRS